MTHIFSSLTHAVSGAPLTAIAAAVLWGILSILLSPCHLASIPLIVGFIDRQGRTTPRRAFAVAFLFSLGILITIGFIGVITVALGRMAGDTGKFGNYLVALVFLLVGLHLLGVIPMPWSGPGQVNMKRKGLLAALILGLVFGIALGPCTFAYMAPMLAVVFSNATRSPLWSGLLLVAYGLGHCSVIVFAGTMTGWVSRYLKWTEKSRSALILRNICGVLVLAGGAWLLWTAQ